MFLNNKDIILLYSSLIVARFCPSFKSNLKSICIHQPYLSLMVGNIIVYGQIRDHR